MPRKKTQFIDPVKFSLRVERATLKAVLNNSDNATAFINSAITEKLKRDHDEKASQSKSI